MNRFYTVCEIFTRYFWDRGVMESNSTGTRPQIVVPATSHSTQTQMKFLFSAVDDGWAVRKRGRDYVFTKPIGLVPNHTEKRYVESFINEYIGNDSYR